MKTLTFLLLMVSFLANAGYNKDKCEFYLTEDPWLVETMVKTDYKHLTGKELTDSVLGAGYAMYCDESFDNSLLEKVYGGE
ncbi:spackle periplasmic [Morganella phage vB_MmoM_MP1]|uniref:Uncharacterized protein n=1 Tax=Morganella phage vB_MmoM_MP1 TaxID=1852628 RepID=A0A192YCK7_9CAUD|nr:spackle periplasmic [Morganella phage vB_MmoM_MP1]ANM46616.1 hypothetical protein MP1_gp0080 [Morganella phage vB_MmoM_MP1]QQK88088.1 hypothetical protein [Providencia phage PSTRCR_127]UGO50117.1 hypothetical protein RGZ1_86 [Morganella phage vB_MmoM_Rgz1]